MMKDPGGEIPFPCNSPCIFRALSLSCLTPVTPRWSLRSFSFPLLVEYPVLTNLRRSILFCLVLSSSAIPALGQGSIGAVYVPACIAGGGGVGATGSPYAVFVRIQGWTACANAQAYVKLYSGTNNEYMWTGTSWSNTTAYSSSNQPVVTIDADGNWAGWIYAKHNDALGSAASLRAAMVGATSTTRVTSAQISFTVLSTVVGGNGGWISSDSSSAVNKCILAFAGGSAVGSYRAEDNGIAEGYPSSAGSVKVAVPAGTVDSLVALNDDGSRDRSFEGPWMVNPGFATSVSSTEGGTGKGTAAILPSVLSGGVSHALTIVIHGDTSATIGCVRVRVPSNWQWSRTPGDVNVSGPGSPAMTVAGDTLLVDGLTLAGSDSALIGISNIVPYDSTGSFLFWTETGPSASSLLPLSNQPSVFVYGTPIPISDVKRNDNNGVPLLNNRLVTVRGIVTVAGQFGSPSYIEDNSGGLAVYGSAFSAAVAMGDEVIVSGLVQPFYGLTEIVNPMLHAVASSGNAVTPVLVTAQQLASDGQNGVEEFEGRLVRIDGAAVSGGGTWAGNTNYTLTDATGATQLRIDDATNLVGAPIPASAFDVIGVVGQFISVAPYIGGYQLMPRSTADILATGPLFATAPAESVILPTSLTITWKTVNNGTTGARFGKTSTLELGLAPGDDSSRTEHVLTLSGLDPATVYYIGVFSAAGTDTSFAAPLIASTASPSRTTGEINAYFNTSVQSQLAWFRPANGTQDLVARLVTRINNAHRSIDAALYSLSGTPGTNIVYALAAARNRGVSVRVICEYDNSASSAFNSLRSIGIPVITDQFDAVNAGAGYMHNKFFIVDGRGGAPDSVWVWTGSWNPTDPGTTSDYQNSIEFQDAALAGAYTLEFNEMWGSSSDVPDAAASRFGARKTDNTPHRFVIGGRKVECYFSPSDHTTSHIISAIDSARHSIAVGTMTLTRSDIAGALIAEHDAGRKVRVILDNSTDTGSQFNTLVSAGIDARTKVLPASYIFHHKYAVVDGENPWWDPVVITGSHNWSSSAENSNNENTVLVHDGDIANQYLQEFAARYYQYGGGDTIYVGIKENGILLPAVWELRQNYPNPFNPLTIIKYTVGGNRGWGLGTSDVSLVVYDILGREVAVLVNGKKQPGTYAVQFDGSALASGVYFYRLTAGNFVQTRKMLLVR
jgi:phosphatidylserine/phosphatidylglycerophosphate/cardiolipin synthase-like enzyme